MNFNIKPSFERIYKKLPHNEKARIDEKIQELFDYYNKDILFAGLKVRKISGRDNFFEIDTVSNRRILIRKHKDLIEFVAYGNHDEVKRFLKNY
jgi:mRNA-degrading endonuclease RelE of RelBE toxin-antitoxin system